MSYILPTALALLIHLALAFSFIAHQFTDLQQSRQMPRHIQAQMYDLKALSTTVKQQESRAKKEVDLAPEKKPEPKPEPEKEVPKVEPEVEPEKTPEPEPVEDTAQKERELQKKQKAEQRKIDAQKLKDELAEKKAEAQKQREIESKRKQAALEKAEQEKAQKEKARKEEQAKKEKAKKEAQKKALAEKKRKEKALADKKKIDAKRKRDEQARIKALQQQIADEEQFAADQVAKEMASGIDVYIQRLIKGNFRIPSTARNGISAMVRIKLLASGRVVGVELINASGNAAFDKAAEQAVWRTESFPRVSEISRASPGYFNRELRTFMINFKPEDLRW